MNPTVLGVIMPRVRGGGVSGAESFRVNSSRA